MGPVPHGRWHRSSCSHPTRPPHGKFGQAKTLPGVAFEVPQLPQGIYDAWYVDGHPTTARAPLQPRIAPADAKASQSITFEIKPRLRVVEAVARGAPGTDVDAAVGFVGPHERRRPPARQHLCVRPRARHPCGSSAASARAGAEPRGCLGADRLARFKVIFARPGRWTSRPRRPVSTPSDSACWAALSRPFVQTCSSGRRTAARRRWTSAEEIIDVDGREVGVTALATRPACRCLRGRERNHRILEDGVHWGWTRRSRSTA